MVSQHIITIKSIEQMQSPLKLSDHRIDFVNLLSGSFDR